MQPMKTAQSAATRRVTIAACSLGLALLLAACSSMEELVDSMEEIFDAPIESSRSSASSSEEARSLAPISGDGVAEPSPHAAAAAVPDLPPSQRTVPINPTGTFVGKKVVQIGSDFAAVQQSVKTHNDQFAQSQTKSQNLTGQYFSTVASINTRLQVGTTAGNPLLGQQWDDAQAQLTETSGNVLHLQELRSLVASDLTTAQYLQDQIHSAYTLSGAVEEDHRQLAMLEEGITREIVAIERLLAQIDTGIARQSAYVASERLNMTTLALAIKRGEPYDPALASSPSLSNGLPPPAASSTATTSSYQPSAIRTRTPTRSNKAAGSKTASAARKPHRQPILVIDFGSANSAYESNLYAAVSEVIASRPSARFEVVAVTPGAKPGASPATSRRNAKRVVRSLVNMGMPEARLRESAQTSPSASSEQVLVYAL